MSAYRNLPLDERQETVAFFNRNNSLNQVWFRLLSMFWKLELHVVLGGHLAANFAGGGFQLLDDGVRRFVAFDAFLRADRGTVGRLLALIADVAGLGVLIWHHTTPTPAPT